MSVLNQSGEEQVECPLCMEPLEVDDLNFYPCTCGYQICRFCWHRIRTDENGLCPACRKAYSENPADFTPLSKEQVAQLKAEKRARDQQRKAKLSESRKHLAAVRVVQKNLVFVVGLPVRLADADVLKRHEYFGKFGKIHKVVINQSTSYAGSQGPSASAYVTYVKSDDALRAIQSVNNIMLDGRLIKSSLGTTKYCSHFMKNQPCPKADCMYLHDFGDPEASFTKEQMHVGKHQEYEKKLHDSLQTRTQQQAVLAQQQQQTQQQQSSQQQKEQQSNTSSTVSDRGDRATGDRGDRASGDRGDKATDKTSEKEKKGREGKDANWPTLHGETNSGGFGNIKTEKQQKSESKSEKSQKKNNQKNKNNNNNTNSTNNNIENSKQKSDKEKEKTNSSKNCEQSSCSIQQQTSSQQQQIQQSVPQTPQSPVNNTSPNSEAPTTRPHISPEPCSPPTEKNKQKEIEPTSVTSECLESLSKMQLLDDNSSFFSHNSFQKILPEDAATFSADSSAPHSNILNDNLPDITSSEDWQAAFGFSTNLKSESPSILSNQISGNGFQQDYRENGFVNHLDNFQKTQQNYELLKTRESILDVLTGRNFVSTTGLNYKIEQNERLNHANPYANLNHKPENGLCNGLDQQMSKFFAEFNNKNGFNHPTNGFPVERPNFLGNQLNLNENQHNMLLLNYQQRVLDKQIEDQALYNLKQNVFQQQQQQQQHNNQQYLQHNHGTPMHHSGSQQFLANGGDHFLSQNGQSFGNFSQTSVFQNPTLQQQRNLQQQLRGGDRASVDDDLGFDPFHETQKALAELIESEQGVQQIQNNGLLGASTSGPSSNGSVNAGGPPVNGLLPGNGAPTQHLPPPPPGFMQHNAHMNSFGSKILPFLNMSNSPQINNSSGGWSTNFSEAQLKGLTPVNDWMTLDPAIVSSSRHFPLANLPTQFPPSLFQQSQTRGPGFDYPQTAHSTHNSHNNHTHTNGYSTQHSQQQPHIPYANGYNHHSQSNGLNWFAGDLQGVSSPPGFRPASKTQEC